MGTANDFMVVRVEQRNVLDASLFKFDVDEVLDPVANVVEDVGAGFSGSSIKCGKWFDV